MEAVYLSLLQYHPHVIRLLGKLTTDGLAGLLSCVLAFGTTLLLLVNFLALCEAFCCPLLLWWMWWAKALLGICLRGERGGVQYVTEVLDRGKYSSFKAASQPVHIRLRMAVDILRILELFENSPLGDILFMDFKVMPEFSFQSISCSLPRAQRSLSYLVLGCWRGEGREGKGGAGGRRPEGVS